MRSHTHYMIDLRVSGAFGGHYLPPRRSQAAFLSGPLTVFVERSAGFDGLGRTGFDGVDARDAEALEVDVVFGLAESA